MEIPAAYRELLAARRRFEATSDRAALWNELGRAPAWPLRLLASWFSPAALGFVVFAASPLIGLALTLGAVQVASALTHVQLFEVYDALRWDWALVAVGYLVVWTGALLGVAGTRRALALGPLQAALAAKPPERAGGAASCRQCGAALTVGPGALHVRCAYCEADNLLAIPASWVRRMQRTVSKTEQALAAVERTWATERERLSGYRLKLVAGLSIATAVMTLLFALQFGEHPVNPAKRPGASSWARARAEHTVRLHTARREGTFWYSELRDAPVDPSGRLVTRTTGPWCGAGRCRVYVDVPTVRGERWTLTCTPAEARATLLAPSLSSPDQAWQAGWSSDPRGVEGTCADFTFTAEWTGFLRLAVQLPEEVVERPLELSLRH